MKIHLLTTLKKYLNQTSKIIFISSLMLFTSCNANKSSYLGVISVNNVVISLVKSIINSFEIEDKTNTYNSHDILDKDLIDVKVDKSLVGVFNLEDFQIETSWLTGEKSRVTNSFKAAKIDDKPWYHKEGNKYVLKALQTDGNRTEWKETPGKQASLKTYKNLQYKANVIDIPTNGVTIAQVHNRGGVKRPFLRVYIDKDRFIKIKVTDTNPASSYSDYKKIKGPYYTEGTDFTLKLVTKKGKVFVEVNTTSGTMKEEISPSRDWKRFKDSYYLKAGVYTEGNDKSPQSTFDYFVFNKQ